MSIEATSLMRWRNSRMRALTIVWPQRGLIFRFFAQVTKLARPLISFGRCTRSSLSNHRARSVVFV